MPRRPDPARDADSRTADVAIVGGGVAGSALAAALARGGLDVVVLERQHRYTDQVRGECLWPWGVVEARRLGCAETLLDAGGHLVDAVVRYGDGEDPEHAEQHPVRLGGLVDRVPGALNVSHPGACAALAEAAGAAGARVRHGVTGVRVTAGPRPSVRFRCDGRDTVLRARLVIGADGRNSRVRHQVGIRLRHRITTHLIAGMLVDGLDVDPTRDVVGIGEDVWMITFPQGGGRARIYLCAGPTAARRFAGAAGPAEFLQAAAVASIPKGQAWAQAVPAGPCRTFDAGDSWTERPCTDGVVLIGDAGGHSNPLIGQGLAMALRDAAEVADILLGGGVWEPAAFARYGSERAERLHRNRVVSQLYAATEVSFGAPARALRRDVRERLRADPSLYAAVLPIFTGPDTLPVHARTEQFRRRYLGIAG